MWLMKRQIAVVLIVGCVLPLEAARGTHEGHERHVAEETPEPSGIGYPIPGASFQVYVTPGKNGETVEKADGEAALRTVIDTLTFMVQRRADYPRFDESLKKEALKQVFIEPTVVSREGKVFAFLVARTKQPGRVTLLISASSLKEQGYLDRPERLAPVLAREFQWVVSKADTARKAELTFATRQPARAPIRTDQDILAMPSEERGRVLEQLFASYLRTVDEQTSLDGQPYYQTGTTTLVPPTQPDSAIKFYEIRVREALHKIVTEPYFKEQTPKAVRSLLNGKIWNVSFVKIDERDWATRTRVLPEDKAVAVGTPSRMIQPATILVNLHRTAVPDDPFYRETQALPMGALSADQLARVIAWEVERNIIEKSMRGHVAQDAATAPK